VLFDDSSHDSFEICPYRSRENDKKFVGLGIAKLTDINMTLVWLKPSESFKSVIVFAATTVTFIITALIIVCGYVPKIGVRVFLEVLVGNIKMAFITPFLTPRVPNYPMLLIVIVSDNQNRMTKQQFRCGPRHTYDSSLVRVRVEIGIQLYANYNRLAPGNAVLHVEWIIVDLGGSVNFVT